MKRIFCVCLSLALVLSGSPLSIMANDDIPTFYGSQTENTGNVTYNINPDVSSDDKSDDDYFLTIYQFQENEYPMLLIQTEKDNANRTKELDSRRECKQAVKGFINGVGNKSYYTDLKIRKIKVDGTSGYLCEFVLNNTYSVDAYMIGTKKGFVMAYFLKDKNDDYDYDVDDVMASMNLGTKD